VIRRVLLAVLLMAVGVVGLGGPASARADDAARPVVLVGTGGLTWSDVNPDDTPALWSMLENGSTAALTVRSVFTNTCPVDGWLSLSAGTRAAAPGPGGDGSRRTEDPCPAVPAPAPTTPQGDGATVPGWAAYVDAANALKFDARPGLLGQQVADAGLCLRAVGPGAAIGGARLDGTVASYAAYSPAAVGATTGECPVTIIDVGSLRDPDDLAEGEPAPDGTRQEQARAIDARIGRVLGATPTDADVIVASLSDAGSSERLRLVAATGPDYPPGELVSPSTRQPGLVQSADLTVTVLDRAGIEVPPELGGATLGSEAGEAAEPTTGSATADRLQHLVDFDEASHEVHPLVPVFFNGFVYAQLAIYLFVLLVWKVKLGSEATQTRLLGIVRAVGVVAASVPASTFLANLIPWWRADHPLPAVVGAVGLFVALISGTALLFPWRHWATAPVAVVSLATMIVLSVDVMTGSRLQMSSLMGLQPVVGGRFYGLGNVSFSLLATSALMLSTVVAHWLLMAGRRTAAGLAVIVIGLVTVVVDGAPAWGADGGGPPALIPGVAFLALSVLGIRLTWRKVVAIGAGTVAVFLLVAYLDHLRPTEDQSHLGRFMQTLLDGGAWDVIARKWQQNMDILVSSTLTILVPFALLFVIYVLARPTSWGSKALERSFQAVPTLRAGLIAWVVTMTIGFFVNDSGVAIPAVGATVAIPLLIAISVTALMSDPTALEPTEGTAAPSRV
jgi:hypothetical protein